jgi:hypothetical protein
MCICMNDGAVESDMLANSTGELGRASTNRIKYWTLFVSRAPKCSFMIECCLQVASCRVAG